MCVKIDKMLIITVKRCDGYQRFIIPFHSLFLCICLKIFITEGYKSY